VSKARGKFQNMPPCPVPPSAEVSICPQYGQLEKGVVVMKERCVGAQ